MYPFEVPALPPSVNSMYIRNAHGGVRKSPKVEDFERECMAYIPRQRNPIDEPCELTLEFTFKKPSDLKKRDLDNLLKVTIDMLSNFLFVTNDNLIHRIVATKKAGERDSVAGSFALLPRSNESSPTHTPRPRKPRAPRT